MSCDRAWHWELIAALRSATLRSCPPPLVAPPALARSLLSLLMSHLGGEGARAAVAVAVAAGASSSGPNSDGLDDSEPLNEIFVESTWRGRALKYDREQQTEAVVTKDVAGQARQMKSSGVQRHRARRHERIHQVAATLRAAAHLICLCLLSLASIPVSN